MRWEIRAGAIAAAMLLLGTAFLLWTPAPKPAPPQPTFTKPAEPARPQPPKPADPASRAQAPAHFEQALLLIHKGPLEQALTEARTAQELDPDNPAYRFRTGVALLYLGRYRDALDIFHAIDPVHAGVDPQFWYAYTAWAHLEAHETTRASILINDYLGANVADPGGLMSSMQALLQARFHNDKQAAQAIDQAVADRGDAPRFRHTAYNLAGAYALLGNQPEAIHWLREATLAGLTCTELFRSDPNLKTLAKNPDFQKLLTEAAQLAGRN